MKRLSAIFIAFLIACSMAGCAAPPESNSSDSDSRSVIVSDPSPSPYQYHPVDASNANLPIRWRDENFRHLIYDAMGWDYSKEVCPRDLSEIKEIFILSDQHILINQTPRWDLEPEENGTDYIWRGNTYSTAVTMNLDDLINFTNLNTLKVCLVEIETLDFLPYISQLKYLWLAGCGIEDISILPECTNVRELRLPGNNISDIAPVTEMILWDLFLPHNNISDISPLNFMRDLPGELVLSFNNISDISALIPHGRDTGFAYLNLRNNNISDISPLAYYDNISILSLSYNNITDFSPIDDLPATNTIYLTGNPST